MKQFIAKISTNKRIAPDHYILSFKMPRKGKEVKPGQFFNIRVSDSYEPLLRRPFSVHKIAKDRVEILYRVVGRATQILSTRKKGGALDIIGPLGNGFDISSVVGRRSSVVLVAGGHGIAPLYALAKRLSAIGYQLSAFIGAKTKKYVVCDKDFRKLRAKVYVATEDGSKGYKGLVTKLLITKLKTYNLKLTTIYACGPKPMLKAVAKIANKNRFACQISMEEYIGCGTGICMGCSIETLSGNRLVCKDGPVFDAKEIVW